MRYRLDKIWEKHYFQLNILDRLPWVSYSFCFCFHICCFNIYWILPTIHSCWCLFSFLLTMWPFCMAPAKQSEFYQHLKVNSPVSATNWMQRCPMNRKQQNSISKKMFLHVMYVDIVLSFLNYVKNTKHSCSHVTLLILSAMCTNVKEKKEMCWIKPQFIRML